MPPSSRGGRGDYERLSSPLSRASRPSSPTTQSSLLNLVPLRSAIDSPRATAGGGAASATASRGRGRGGGAGDGVDRSAGDGATFGAFLSELWRSSPLFTCQAAQCAKAQEMAKSREETICLSRGDIESDEEEEEEDASRREIRLESRPIKVPGGFEDDFDSDGSLTSSSWNSPWAARHRDVLRESKPIRPKQLAMDTGAVWSPSWGSPLSPLSAVSACRKSLSRRLEGGSSPRHRSTAVAAVADAMDFDCGARGERLFRALRGGSSFGQAMLLLVVLSFVAGLSFLVGRGQQSSTSVADVDPAADAASASGHIRSNDGGNGRAHDHGERGDSWGGGLGDAAGVPRDVEEEEQKKERDSEVFGGWSGRGGGGTDGHEDRHRTLVGGANSGSRSRPPPSAPEASGSLRGPRFAFADRHSDEEEGDWAPGRRDCRRPDVGDRCFRAVEYGMHEGIWRSPEDYPGLATSSTFEEFQALLHEHGREGCPPPCSFGLRSRGGSDGGAPHAGRTSGDRVAEASARDPQPPSPPRQRVRKEGAALPPHPFGRELLTFYMYRAEVGDASYARENMNAADLAGAMEFIHSALDAAGRSVQDSAKLTFIRRFKVSALATPAFYREFGRQFAPFSEFSRGRSEAKASNDIWREYGPVLGCRLDRGRGSAYLAATRTSPESCSGPEECRPAVWYSLPGACPGEALGDKSSECMAQMPGGLCAKVSGDPDCTFSVEEAGSVRIDELVSSSPSAELFWKGPGNVEFCAQRLRVVKRLFKEKYPGLPGCDDLLEPPCDSAGAVAPPPLGGESLREEEQ